MGNTVELRDSAPLSLDAPIERRSANVTVPVTPTQRRIWNYYTTQKDPLSVRMCAGTARLSGTLDIDVLQRSIEVVMERHESLRTRILPCEEGLRQHVDEPSGYKFEVFNSPESGDSATGQARCLVQEFLNEKIDLARGPLFAARLIQMNAREHVLALGLHHVVGDGVSHGILNREIWELYHQDVQQQAVSLPAPPLQFGDYAVWQERTFHSWYLRHAAYWKTRLMGAPRVQLFDSTVIAEPPVEGAVAHFPLGRDVTGALGALAKHQETKLPLTILAAYLIVMSRLCQQEDLTVAFATHGRYGRRELAQMIGFLATPSWLRITLQPGMTFLEVLDQVRYEFAASTQHKDFDRVPDLVPECYTEIGFNWLPYRTARASPQMRRSVAGPLKIEPFTYNTLEPMHFIPFFYGDEGGAGVTVHFGAEQHLRELVHRFGRNFLLAVRAIAANVVIQVGSLASALE
jgi:hypothetical protein